jgi:hypothetical protein
LAEVFDLFDPRGTDASVLRMPHGTDRARLRLQHASQIAQSRQA